MRHRIVFEGPRGAGDTMNGIVKDTVECSCGKVTVGDDQKAARDLHNAHVPDDTTIAVPPSGRRR